MTRIHGFPPIVGARPVALVLGSMPSVASLGQARYYANPQNSFWKIMAALFWPDETLNYTQQSARLATHRIVVWDVLASCVRPGSLDSAIEMHNAVANNFLGLFTEYSSIESVFFNGRKAEQIYQRSVVADLQLLDRVLHYHSMPSTSPAMATLSFDKKLECWRELHRVVTTGP